MTTRIDNLIQSYETNIAQQANAMAGRAQMIQARSTRILGSIALGAIILAILFIGISWRDLSRNNRYRKELEEANRKAEELLLTREKLMLAITHDIKAPLSSVMGYLDLLQCMEQPNEKSEMYIHHMQNASGHLMKLVTDLLDIHRLDLKKREIKLQSFNPV